MVIDKNFWLGKRVLVTGHTGFKGSWLSLWLLRLGSVVSGFSLPPQNPSAFIDLQIGDEIQNFYNDIRDASALQNAVEQARPEIIFHLAAQALVLDGYENPAYTYDVNLMGTVNLLEAVRKSQTAKAVLIITSDKVYRNNSSGDAFTEANTLGGLDPYSSSKACAELAVNCYRESFMRGLGIMLATARAGNVVGGGDYAKNRLAPDFLHALESNQPLSIRTPEARRPWQFVLDPLYGYLLYMQLLFSENTNAPPALNFSGSLAQSWMVSEIADLLCNLTGAKPWQAINSDAPPEHKLLLLDSTLANQTLKWSAKFNTSQAFEQAVLYWQARQSGENMRQFAEKVIGDWL